MPSVRYFTAKDQNRLKVKGLVKISHANNQKKVRVAILISEKIDFKFFEKVIKDKEGYYIRENICPPRHAHGDLTSLAPHERLPEILVVPREKTPTGAAARGNP